MVELKWHFDESSNASYKDSVWKHLGDAKTLTHNPPTQFFIGSVTQPYLVVFRASNHLAVEIKPIESSAQHNQGLLSILVNKNYIDSR